MTIKPLTSFDQAIVSVFRSNTDTQPARHASVGAILDEIEGDAHAARIESLRPLAEAAYVAWCERYGRGRKSDAEKLYDDRKGTLTAVTFSGRFRKRGNDFLEEHSTFFVVDIDHINRAALEQWRLMLEADPFTAFLFESPSGHGLKIGVRIPADRHAEAFPAARAYYRDRYDLTIDEACKDVARLCYIGHDPGLYRNPDALLFPIEDARQPTTVAVTPTGALTNGHTNGHANGHAPSVGWHPTEDDVREMLGHIPQRPPYAEWVSIVSAIANHFDDPAITDRLCREWSPEEEKGEYQYKHGHRLRKGIAALIAIAKTYGYDPQQRASKKRDATTRASSSNRPRGSKLADVREYIADNYDLRYNVVLMKGEIRPKETEDWEEMDDRRVNSLWCELDAIGLHISAANLDKLLASDFATPFDPFIDYFESLPAWDGDDHIGQLAMSVSVGSEHQARFRWALERFLMALVKSATTPGVANQTALIFNGSQGRGKTTWLDELVPPRLCPPGYPSNPYRHTGAFKSDHRDSTLRLASKLLINLDELEGMNGGDLTSLKSDITKTSINERAVYGKRDMTLPRRASFCGSVNKGAFLRDETGSRRFLVFTADAFENNGRHGIDMDKVYSQVLYLLSRDGRWWFQDEEIDELTEHNRAFEQLSFADEILMKHFEPVDRDDEKGFGVEALQTTALVQKLMMMDASLERVGIERLTKAFGYALTRQGFVQFRKKIAGVGSRQVWLVKAR